jgi:hypothetical protein
MIKIWNWIRNNPNRAMFLVPIILVAAISISHVVTWYDMANPINWAIYLSIAIEIAAMTALVAVDSKIKGGIWFMFGIVTFIQVLGNVFYCYKEIDSNGTLFIAWVELTSPVWELLGTEITDTISLKRWLAFLEGGLLPIISLTSLHFFITYKKEDEKDNEEEAPFELKMSVPEGKEFNTPYPIPNFDKEDNESDENVDHSLVEEVIPEDEVSEKPVKESTEQVFDKNYETKESEKKERFLHEKQKTKINNKLGE